MVGDGHDSVGAVVVSRVDSWAENRHNNFCCIPGKPVVNVCRPDESTLTHHTACVSPFVRLCL